jgi:hypothetical protein
MYINRAILLFFLLIFLFTPSFQAWILHDGTAWYRPWVAWAGVIALSAWVNYRLNQNEI